LIAERRPGAVVTNNQALKPADAASRWLETAPERVPLPH